MDPQCEACLVVNRALGRCVCMHFENTPLTSEKREEEENGGYLCIKVRCTAVYVVDWGSKMLIEVIV